MKKRTFPILLLFYIVYIVATPALAYSDDFESRVRQYEASPDFARDLAARMKPTRLHPTLFSRVKDQEGRFLGCTGTVGRLLDMIYLKEGQPLTCPKEVALLRHMKQKLAEMEGEVRQAQRVSPREPEILPPTVKEIRPSGEAGSAHSD